MKKKNLLLVLVILVVIISTVIGFILYKNDQETKEKEKNQERYAEIKESVRQAVEWNIRATLPRCSIIKEVDEVNPGEYFNSSLLINRGYIKQRELLDIDEESYCDVYVVIEPYINEPSENCETHYKIYLKCKDYVDKGYIYWGN